MSKPILVFDARAITAKPCGVRRVAEGYLNHLGHFFDLVVLINEGSPAAVPATAIKILLPRFLGRFNPISDLVISFIVIKLRPAGFFSPHSFLPVFAFLPRKRIFISHDLFASLDKNFFKNRGMFAPILRAIFRLLSEISVARASCVVTPSYASRRQLDSLLFSPRSVSVIPNGVTFDDTLPGTAQASKSVLFIGNFRYYKGIDILLASWKRAKTSNSRSEWRLTIITNESQFEVERIRIRFGLDENVSFFSRINDAEATHLRNQAAVVVLPSRHEGFGIPLLEAVAAGRHVLHSNIEAFTELTSHFNLKQFTSFEAGSTDALVDALNHVLEHEDSLLNTKDRDYIFNNREVLTERFSWDVSVLGLNEILTSET